MLLSVFYFLVTIIFFIIIIFFFFFLFFFPFFLFVSFSWNHAELQSLNPTLVLPSHAIEVVIQQDSASYLFSFSTLCAELEPSFAARVAPAYNPVWPTTSYAAFHPTDDEIDPASYVLATPYSIGVSLLSYPKKLGTAIARMVNRAGTVVEPTFQAIQAAYQQMGVKSQRNAKTGALEYQPSESIADAPGQTSWP